MENHHLMTGQTVKFDFIPAVRLLYGQFDALRFQSNPADCLGNLYRSRDVIDRIQFLNHFDCRCIADISAGHLHLAAAVDRIHVKQVQNVAFLFLHLLNVNTINRCRM